MIMGKSIIDNWKVDYSAWGMSQDAPDFGVLGLFWVFAYRYPVRLTYDRRIADVNTLPL